MSVGQLAVLGVLVGRCMIGCCCSRFSGCVDHVSVLLLLLKPIPEGGKSFMTYVQTPYHNVTDTAVCDLQH